MTSNYQSGFSLVELLVTLALLGIIIGLATGPLSELLAHHRQAALRDQVYGILQNARAQAVLQGSTVEVCGSSDARNCSANWASGWLTRELSRNLILNVTQLPNHDNLRWSGFMQNIRFRRNGTSPASNGRFYQCHRDQVAWQLILNRQGRIRQATSAENQASTLCSS